MKCRPIVVLLILLFLICLAGCMAGTNQLRDTSNDNGNVAGFWRGLWQGLIAPIAFVVSLFKDNVSIYEVHNNGGWYNFGFLLGAGIVFGGGGSRTGPGFPSRLRAMPVPPCPKTTGTRAKLERERGQPERAPQS